MVAIWRHVLYVYLNIFYLSLSYVYSNIFYHYHLGDVIIKIYLYMYRDVRLPMIFLI